MPQISKVERERDIKQVSRSDDLKPATEKTISKSIPKIQNKASSKELTEIAEQKETASSMPVTASIKAARRAGIAAIRHARTMSQDSGKQEDQEAIDNLEVSARNTAADTADALLDARDSLKSRIKKKRPDIKNTKDIKSGVRTINKADRSIKSATEATRVAAKSAQEAAKQAAITSQKVASAKKAEQLAKKSAEWVKKIVKGIIEGLKRLGAALGAASVPLLLILVLASLIAGIVASAFGIFFAGDESGENTRTLQEVVLEINGEYNGQIEQIKTNTAHDAHKDNDHRVAVLLYKIKYTALKLYPIHCCFSFAMFRSSSIISCRRALA